MDDALKPFQESLKELERSHLFRELISINSPQDARIIIGGKEYINLSSNNYLGLCNHPALKEAALEAIKRYGTGAGASRLVSGNMELYEELETLTATFKGTEAALVFNSGYMANVGLLQALAEEGDAIFSDRLNHASIIDGCRLSKADVFVYGHSNVEELDTLLSKNRHRRRKIIITESVFSMDGDIAPLKEIYGIAKANGAILIIDDAHATGVLGENGRGGCEYFNIRGDDIIQMGTYSKALGSFGAYVACSRVIRDLLINRARSLIYTTALPPGVLGASIGAIREIMGNRELIKRLKRNIEYFKAGLKRRGYQVHEYPTPIIPIILGDEKKTLDFARYLRESGIYAVAIRPPTVPSGTSRIRMSITASHTRMDLDRTLDAIGRIERKMGL